MCKDPENGWCNYQHIPFQDRGSCPQMHWGLVGLSKLAFDQLQSEEQD